MNNIDNVPYGKLIKLPTDACVRVDRSYFYFLMAKNSLLPQKQHNVSTIFSKYIELAHMEEFIKEQPIPYYAMTVEEIKILIRSLDDVPPNSAILTSELTKEELEENQESLKKQFIEKAQKLKSLEKVKEKRLERRVHA